MLWWMGVNVHVVYPTSWCIRSVQQYIRLPKRLRARRALAAVFAASAAAALVAVKPKQSRIIIPNAETHTYYYGT